MVSEQSLLAQLFVDVVEFRNTDAGIANRLDPTANTRAALGANHEAAHATNHKRQQCRDTKRTHAQTNTAPRTTMHQVAQQQPGSSAE
jgi:hypothetical protein